MSCNVSSMSGQQDLTASGVWWVFWWTSVMNLKTLWSTSNASSRFILYRHTACLSTMCEVFYSVPWPCHSTFTRQSPGTYNGLGGVQTWLLQPVLRLQRNTHVPFIAAENNTRGDYCTGICFICLSASSHVHSLRNCVTFQKELLA